MKHVARLKRGLSRVDTPCDAPTPVSVRTYRFRGVGVIPLPSGGDAPCLVNVGTLEVLGHRQFGKLLDLPPRG